MSANCSVNARIWLIDKLHPKLSFEEFSNLAEGFAEYIYKNNELLIAQNAPQHTREGRKPTDKKMVLENGETLNIKEIYFETYASSMCALEFSDYIKRLHKPYIDRHWFHKGIIMDRYISAPDKKLMTIREYCEKLLGDKHKELEGKFKDAVQDDNGVWWAYGDWIDENPDWKFEKVVADDLPRLLIESELDYEE